MKNFSLDPRLDVDTIRLAESELSLLLLMNDSRYPWLILVPKQMSLREIYELSEFDQVRLMHESCVVAKAITNLNSSEKINIGALGNLVPQLHLHHVGRTNEDPAWPHTVWGHSAPTRYSDTQKPQTINMYKTSNLQTTFSFL